MDHRALAHAGALQVRHCRKDLVLNLDEVAGVLRDITRDSNRHGDRLADVPCLVDSDGIICKGSLYHAGHRTDQIRDVLSRDDAPNSWQLSRLRDVDSPDAGMRMGRTQDRCEAKSGNWRQIVNEACLPSQERLILFARNRRAYPSLRCDRSCSQGTVNHQKR